MREYWWEKFSSQDNILLFHHQGGGTGHTLVPPGGSLQAPPKLWCFPLLHGVHRPPGLLPPPLSPALWSPNRQSLPPVECVSLLPWSRPREDRTWPDVEIVHLCPRNGGKSSSLRQTLRDGRCFETAFFILWTWPFCPRGSCPGYWAYRIMWVLFLTPNLLTYEWAVSHPALTNLY